MLAPCSHRENLTEPRDAGPRNPQASVAFTVRGDADITADGKPDQSDEGVRSTTGEKMNPQGLVVNKNVNTKVDR
jgi:hypothetical protein